VIIRLERSRRDLASAATLDTNFMYYITSDLSMPENYWMALNIWASYLRQGMGEAEFQKIKDL